MILERTRPAAFQVQIHAIELATLLSAARWAMAGGDGELTTSAKSQLEQVVASYDQQMERLRSEDRPTLPEAAAPIDLEAKAP